MRKVYAALTAAILGLGLAVVPMVAHAVPPLRPTPPAGATIWAPLLTQWPVSTGAYAPQSLFTEPSGGWMKRDAGPLQQGSLSVRSTGNPATPDRPRVVRTTDAKITEPYAPSTGGIAVGVRLTTAAAKGDNVGARVEVVGGTGGSGVYCATTEWPTALGTFRQHNSWATGEGWNAAPNNGDVAIQTDNTFTLAWGTSSLCTRISAMVLVLRTYDSSATPQLHRFEWTANDAWLNTQAYIVTDPKERICQGTAGLDVAECLPYRGDYDPVDFDRVCAGAPTPEWLDFSWVVPTIGHFSNCLFRPLGGWDDDGVLASSLNGSVISEVGGAVTAAVESFRVAPSCGMLLSQGGDGPLSGFAINTCDWTWGALLRDALFWLVTVGVTMWAIRYFLDGLESILDRKGTSPVSTAAASS